MRHAPRTNTAPPRTTTAPRGTATLRRAAALGVLLLAVLSVGTGPASAHSVGGSGATGFRTTIEPLVPAVPGLSLKVVENGTKLELDNSSGSDVVVDGYVGEPYAKVGPGGSFVNTMSPATYINTDRWGTTPVPDGVDPSRPAVWKKESSGSTWLWHDHRIHWMSTTLPPTVTADPHHSHRISTWTLTLHRDGQTITATGHLDWIPGPSRWPSFIGGGILIAATAGLALLPARRRPRKWLGAAAVTLTLADVFHSLGVAADIAGGLGARAGAFLSGNVVQFAAWAATGTAGYLLLRRKPPAIGVFWLAAAAGLLTALASGLPDLSVLWQSSAPFAGPMPLARLLILLVTGLGFGLAAALPLYLRRTQGTEILEELEEDETDTLNGPSRRLFLTTGATGVGGMAVGATAAALLSDDKKQSGPVTESGPLISSLGATTVTAPTPHQAGIVTPARQQAHGTVAAFDLVEGTSRHALSALLRAWTDAIAALTAGHGVQVPANGTDTGGDGSVAAGSGPSSLTITVGFGPSLFGKAGLDPASRPQELTPLPTFSGETLDPARSDGDLGVVIAADDPLVVFHAARTLTRLAAGTAKPRWSMSGFTRAPGSAPDDAATPRNLMGQFDGTDNPAAGQPDFDARVFVQPASGTAWMRGGSYLVVRRIRMLLDAWDQIDQSTQERVIGRRKSDGAPLSGGREHSTVNFAAQNSDGSLAIAPNAHIRLATPAFNNGAAMVRRGLSYHDGLAADGGPDAGLLFLAWQADPHRGFIPVQQNLTHGMDSLNRFVRHETSALFAVVPAAAPGGYLGQALLEPGSAAASQASASPAAALPSGIADGGIGQAVMGLDGIQRITVTADNTLRYHPSVIRMTPGAIEVTFRNTGSVPHTLTESGTPLPDEPSAGVANLPGGDQTVMSLKLTRVGDYPFQCGYHAGEGMYAVIEVR